MTFKSLPTRDDVRQASVSAPLADLGPANLLLAIGALPVPAGCPKPHVEYVESV